MKWYVALVLLGSACSVADMPQAVEDALAPSPVDALLPAPRDAGSVSDGGLVDVDRDGLDDREEARIARAYLPYLSIASDDACPLAGIVYRLRPHPAAPMTRLQLIAAVLYQRDCGLDGHIGDDEVFGVTIDATRPPPAGILTIRAIAHQNTACQLISECGSCTGMKACTTAMRDGAPYPVVFPSKNKHGNYMSTQACDGACFLTNYCALAAKPANLPLVNAGEPGAPLTRDLTKEGFITSGNGWSEPKLMHYDPWGNTNFGGAGNVTSDLDDSAFLTLPCT